MVWIFVSMNRRKKLENYMYKIYNGVCKLCHFLVNLDQMDKKRL